jgi:hypothetical protein
LKGLFFDKLTFKISLNFTDTRPYNYDIISSKNELNCARTCILIEKQHCKFFEFFELECYLYNYDPNNSTNSDNLVPTSTSMTDSYPYHMKTYSSEKGKAIFSIPKKMAFAVNVPGVDVLLNEGSTLHNLTMLCNISLVIHLTMIIIVYGSILPPFPNNWVAIVG